MQLANVTITNRDTAQSLTLGDIVQGVDRVGFLLDEVQLDPAPYLVERTEVPYRDGGELTRGRRRIREVNVSGSIWARTRKEGNSLRAQLIAAVSGSTVALAFTPQELELELVGMLDGGVRFSKGRWEGEQEWEFTLLCADPIAYDTVVRSHEMVPFPGAVVTHQGTYESWPVITVTCDTGPVTSLTLRNETVQRSFVLDVGFEMSPGQLLVIDMAPGRESALLDGISVLGTRSPSSRFWSIKPGENTLYQNVAGGTVTATVEWRDGWDV